MAKKVARKTREEKIDDKGFMPLMGRISEHLSGLKFRIEFDNGHTAICQLKGKLAQNRTVVVGDKVECHISVYDMSNGYVVRVIKE